MDLLKRARARAEFERFAASHADGLLRAAYLMVGDRGEAKTSCRSACCELLGNGRG